MLVRNEPQTKYETTGLRIYKASCWRHAASRCQRAIFGVLRVNEQELRKRLTLLRSEHRDLDVAIAALSEAGRERGFVDQLQLARLKKRKLALKDRIAAIEDMLLPDIIA